MNSLRKTLSGLLLILMATSIGLLTACGEGFKAVELESAKTGANRPFADDPDEIPVGETVPQIDQSIYDSYANERNGLDSSTVQGFISKIEAFGLELKTTEHPGGGSENTSARSILLTGCANYESTEIYDSSVDFNGLLNGERVHAGYGGLYEVILECTIENCDEMMAVIRRRGDDTIDAMAFIGLKKKGSNEIGSRSVTRNYIYRQVQINSDIATVVEPEIYLDNECRSDDSSSPETTTNNTVHADPFGGEMFGPFLPEGYEFNIPAPVEDGESF